MKNNKKFDKENCDEEHIKTSAKKLLFHLFQYQVFLVRFLVCISLLFVRVFSLSLSSRSFFREICFFFCGCFFFFFFFGQMFSCGPGARSSYYLPVFMDFQARHVTSEWRTRVRSASVKRNHPSNYSKGIKWERFAAAGQRNVCALSLFVFNSSVPNRFFFFYLLLLVMSTQKCQLTTR